MEENKILPKRLKSQRLKLGLLQKEVAEKINMTTSAYGFYEQGKRTPDANTLKLLAEILESSTDYLLGNEEMNFNESSAVKNSLEENKDLTKRDLKQIEKDLEKMMDDIKSNPNDGFAAFDGKTEMDEDDLELLEDAFRTALKVVKKLNKQTYTPNKYKNNK